MKRKKAMRNFTEDEERMLAEMQERAKQAGWIDLEHEVSFRVTACEHHYGNPRRYLYTCHLFGGTPHAHVEFTSEEGEAFLLIEIFSQEGAHQVGEALEQKGYIKGLTPTLLTHPAILALPQHATPEELTQIEACVTQNHLMTHWHSS